MSGGNKQQFKQFTINSIQDACLVLGMLISGVSLNLDKYKEYALEAESLLCRTESKLIPAKEYDDINDKLLFRQREMLKYTADHQSSSFSYIDLRKLLENRKYITAQLSQDTIDTLSELLDIRNWTFHNPQSMMVAAREAAEKNIPAELAGIAQVIPQLNPILIQKNTHYETLMLFSLVFHARQRITQFEMILESMKSDYQTMYDSIEGKQYLLTPQGFSSTVQYVEVTHTASLSDYSSDIAQISMAIQKSKYDGSAAKFKDWVVRFEKEVSNSGT